MTKVRDSTVLALFVVLSLVLPGCAATPSANQPAATDFWPRKQPNVVRVLNWNVKVNSVFPPGARHASFLRLVRAVSPDIICLQEILLKDADQSLISLIEQALPDSIWAVHTVSDNAVISRFALRRQEGEEVIAFPLPMLGLEDFAYGHAMVLVDIPESISEQDLYLIAVHNKSRSGADNIAGRERQSDAIARSVRHLMQVDQPDGLIHGTPIAIIGDLNVLENEPNDRLRHLSTLMSGDIVDEDTFGADHPPDWDGSGLVDLRPSHNGRGRDFYTWRVDHSDFSPGMLDRILYTDSVMTVSHSFVLNTTVMNPDELKRAGLRADDVLYEGLAGNFDHLPMVVDFVLEPVRLAPQGLR